MTDETRAQRTARHADCPGRIGTLDKAAPDVSTLLIGPKPCGHSVRAQLRVAGQRVVEARWKSFGCGALNGAMSFACEWAEGRTLEEIEGGLEQAVRAALLVPTDRDVCLDIAVEVLAGVARQARLSRT